MALCDGREEWSLIVLAEKKNCHQETLGFIRSCYLQQLQLISSGLFDIFFMNVFMCVCVLGLVVSLFLERNKVYF